MPRKLPGRALDSNTTITINTISFGSNLTVNTTVIAIGNSTVNTVVNSTSVTTTEISGNGANITSVNAATLDGNTASTLRSYSDSVGATAFTNAASRADSAYTNATSYADTVAGQAFSNAATRADSAYSNAVSYADTKAGQAYSNAIAYSGNAVQAYTNATSYADTVAATAFTNAASRADSAYSNAVSYAASNTYVNNTFLPLAGGTLTGNITVNATANIVSNLSANNVTFRGDVQIDGNLVVSGTSVTLNVASFVVEDNILHLNNGSTETHPDLGFAGNYNDGSYKHAGFFRDATDGVWKVFDGYTPEPDASAFIDTSNASFRIANFTANVITANSFAGNGASITSVNAATVGGNTASTLRSYSDSVGATAYSNAVSYAAANSYVNSTFAPLAGASFTGDVNIASSGTRYDRFLRIYRGSDGIDQAGVVFGTGPSTDNWFVGHPYLNGATLNAFVVSEKPVIRDGSGTLIKTPAMYFTPGSSTGSGNVGIGTINPTSKLHVVDGFIAVDSSGSTDNYYLECRESGTTRFNIYENNDVVYLNSHNSMRFRANQTGGSGGTFAFSGGNVSISDSFLFVGQDVRSNGQIRATGWFNTPSSTTGGPAIEIGWSTHGYILSYDRNYGTYGRMYFNANSFHLQTQGTQEGTYIGNSSATHAFFASNGNFGVGNTTPVHKLQVEGSSVLLRNATSNVAFYLGNSSYGFDLDYGTGKISIITNGAYRLTADNTGNIGVRTTSPQYPFHVSCVETGIAAVGSGAGYTQGALVSSSGTDSSPSARGQGLFLFNSGANTTWYIGTNYVATDLFSINRKTSTTSLDTSTAQGTFSAFAIDITGRLMLNTTTANTTANTILTVKTFTSNTGNFSFEFRDSANALRSTITDRGAQNWYIMAADGLEKGSIRYSTPGGFVGILYFDNAGLSRSDFRHVANGGFTWHAHSLGTVPPELMRLDNTGNVSITGRITMAGQPAFIAYTGGNHEPTSPTTIPYNATTINRGSHYNTGTYRFTAPVAGVYFFKCRTWMTQGYTGVIYVYLYVNGGVYSETRFGSSTALPDYHTHMPQWMVSLNAGDYVEIVGNGNGSGVYHTSSGTRYSEFSGYLVA